MPVFVVMRVMGASLLVLVPTFCAKVSSTLRRAADGLAHAWLLPAQQRALRGKDGLVERAVRENGSVWLVDNYREVDALLGPGWDLGQALRDYFRPALFEPMPPQMISILKALDRRNVAFS